MTLEVLRCPNCHAPVDDFRGSRTVCRYCSATLQTKHPVGVKTETLYSLALSAGPSNVERIVALLCERLGIAVERARAAASGSEPVGVGKDSGAARSLAREVEEAGGRAEVLERNVEVALVRVWLEAVGPNKLKTIVALRQHVDLDIHQAREMVTRTPVVVAQAQQLLAALEQAGARGRVD
jgi:ribosomal protein L7/L12